MSDADLSALGQSGDAFLAAPTQNTVDGWAKVAVVLDLPGADRSTLDYGEAALAREAEAALADLATPLRDDLLRLIARLTPDQERLAVCFALNLIAQRLLVARV